MDIDYDPETNTVFGYIGKSGFSITIRETPTGYTFLSYMANGEHDVTLLGVPRDWGMRIVASADPRIEIQRDAIIGAKQAGTSTGTQIISVSSQVGPTSLGKIYINNGDGHSIKKR